MRSQRIALHSLNWTLTGFQPFEWQLARSLESDTRLCGDVGPVPAQVPGSVQKSLLDAQMIPDWNTGIQARSIEWVENRHWLYRVVLPAGTIPKSQKVHLVCEGLDYRGWIFINNDAVHAFENGFIHHRIDISEHVTNGENTLMIVFDCPPRWLGQFGKTSEITDWKARFNYGWDWTSRLVQIGIWDQIYLEVMDEAFYDLCVHTDCSEDGHAKSLHVHAQLDCAPERDIRVDLYKKDDENSALLHSFSAPAHHASRDGVIVDLAAITKDLETWYPNGMGGQSLYTVTVSLVDADNPDTVFHTEHRVVGFKHVAWKQNPGCRRDADPWWCHVNGEGLFLQGINWTPIRPNFADVTEEQYRDRLSTYKRLGVNLLRVWGGASLEKEIFYEICDEMGILVWQELPLSSSGLCNYPPDDAQSIQELGEIAQSYVRRRMHHASHLLWCGGNELCKEGERVPIGMEHPLMQHFKRIVDQLDPCKCFLPSAPAGPRFSACESEYGKGLHWAVNGPWRAFGHLDDQWMQYWEQDDALFRSETGLAGPSSVELIRKYNDPLPVFPCNRDNLVWRRQSWWVEWDQFRAEHGRDAASLEEYVEWGQQRQCRGLTHAARCCKERYPRCGGFIVWMGHDAFPCTANTSIIDFDGTPKPVAEALGEIFNDKAPLSEKE